MKRLNFHTIQDKIELSRLLDRTFEVLGESPLQVRQKAVAWDCGISEHIFTRLRNLHRNPADAANLNVEDFHILLSNTLFRFPTVKLWLDDDGEIFFEM